MAAGQQKKRLISSNLHEHFKGKKKKKLESSDYVLNLRSQIYLEWDGSHQRAVAKREQIGIKWADMSPFVDSVPQFGSGLADVLSVPQEIFGVENLMEVLSYEVWATCLSESERKLLTQFLPGGTVAEQAVHSLLTGENLHFGNPSIRWSTLLCSGNLHPDVLLRREQQIRAKKRKSYSKLNKYHTDMVEVLKKWKERWSTCKDPEKLWRKGSTKNKQGSLLISTESAKVSFISKKEMPQKVCIRNGDIAKYLSYIKVSKEQHEVIKNLKNSGDGIQSKSLNRILGDIKGFRIHSYEALEEEEKNKLHEHWLKVVNKDLPLAFESREEKKLQRQQLKKCLVQEIAEKKTSIIKQIEEMESPESSTQEQIEDGETEQCPEHIILQEDGASTPYSDHGHQLERVPSLNSQQELNNMALDQETVGQHILISVDNSPVIPQFYGQNNLSVGVVETKASAAPAKDMWHAVDSHGYSSSGNLSLRQHQPLEERRAPMIDLERDIMEQESGEPNGGVPVPVSVPVPLFCSYDNQGQEELLPPFSKGPELLSSYHPHEHVSDLKQPELQFLMANSSLSGCTQFPNPFQEQRSLIDQRQPADKELYMHQMMNRSIYSNGSRFQNQGLYSSGNDGLVEHNWFPDNVRARSNCWPTVEASNSGAQCLGESGNADGSLFSVLSGCRNLPSRPPYQTMNSGQSMEARNFAPNGNSVYGYVPPQFRSASSHEAAAANPSTLNVPWMNYPPHQNSSLQDSIGKPFMRPWNQ